MNHKRSFGRKRWFLLLLAAVLLLQPAGGRTVRAQEPQNTAGAQIRTEAQLQEGEQTKTTGQAEALQEQADALTAAHLAAWEQAKQEYAAQLAAYQQALEARQAEEGSQTADGQEQMAQAAWLTEYQQVLAGQPAESAAQAAAQQQAALAAQEAVQAPQAAAGAPAVEGAVPFTPLAGKTVSILGDSISTYQGWIPAGYACFYPDAGNNVQDVGQTWWMQVIQNTGMRLLVNGSYSASTVCGDSRAEDSSAGCSSRRIVDLMGNTGTVPDVILVFLGVNDFFRSIGLGSFSGTATYRNDHYIWDFTEGYELMLQKLQAVYPTSRIYCMTLIEANSWEGTRVNANGNTVEDYNSRIRQVAAAHGIPVIDVHACGIGSNELGRYTSDGVHPNREGAARIATYVTNALLMAG